LITCLNDVIYIFWWITRWIIVFKVIIYWLIIWLSYTATLILQTVMNTIMQSRTFTLFVISVIIDWILAHWFNGSFFILNKLICYFRRKIHHLIGLLFISINIPFYILRFPHLQIFFISKINLLYFQSFFRF
jgi:hypothetical protein